VHNCQLRVIKNVCSQGGFVQCRQGESQFIVKVQTSFMDGPLGYFNMTTLLALYKKLSFFYLKNYLFLSV